jgi:hypothetical protein
MTTGANNFSLDILNCVPYQSISNGGVQSAISTLATQLSTYRSQGTAVAAVGVLRDLIEDVLRGQGGQVVESITVDSYSLEFNLPDPVAVTALTTCRGHDFFRVESGPTAALACRESSRCTGQSLRKNLLKLSSAHSSSDAQRTRA